jgi:hypothetical protein
MNLAWTPSERLVTTTTLSAYANSERDFGLFSIDVAPFNRATRMQIGRASCRERVSVYV